jgi:hypothetical protein
MKLQLMPQRGARRWLLTGATGPRLRNPEPARKLQCADRWVRRWSSLWSVVSSALGLAALAFGLAPGGDPPAQVLATVFGVLLIVSAGGVLLQARLGLYLALVGSAFLTLLGTAFALVSPLFATPVGVAIGIAGLLWFQYFLAWRECFG